MKCLLIFCGLIIGSLLQAQTQFALLTDLHVSPGNANERALVRIIDEINHSGLPFVIITGDITNQGSNDELMNMKRLLSRFTKPWYLIPGNHETTWSQSAVGEYYRLFGQDRFFFQRGNLLFVGYNTGPYMKMGDGHVKREDILWLDSILTKKSVKGTRLFTFAHYPLVENDMGNAREVVKVLKKHNAIAAFCGHGHAYHDMIFGNLKGIMARSTFLGQDTLSAGYTIVRLSSDSVFVNEKQPGEPARVRFAFSMDASKKMKAEKRTAYKQKLPRGTSISLLFQDKASIFTGVAVNDSSLYFANSLGEIKSLSKLTGKMIWHYSTGYSLYSTPVCAQGSVMVPAVDSVIYSFSAGNGHVRWKVKTGSPVVADGVAADGKLYQGGYKSFFCIDVASGHVDWRFTDIGNYCQARPAITDGRVIFGAWDTHLYCLNRQTGAMEWKWNNGKAQNLYSPADCVPVVSHNKVIVVAPDRYMTAFDLTDGHQLWRSNRYQVRESQGISEDGKTVFAKLMTGQLLAVFADSAAFTPAWVVDTDLGSGYEHAPCPILVKGRIVFLGSRNGEVVAVDQNSRKILWRYKCGNSEVNQFSVDARGDIYFSLVEGKIYRIRIKR